jgi:hypothetical protein
MRHRHQQAAVHLRSANAPLGPPANPRGSGWTLNLALALTLATAQCANGEKTALFHCKHQVVFTCLEQCFGLYERRLHGADKLLALKLTGRANAGEAFIKGAKRFIEGERDHHENFPEITQIPSIHLVSHFVPLCVYLTVSLAPSLAALSLSHRLSH